jgi:starch synthase
MMKSEVLCRDEGPLAAMKIVLVASEVAPFSKTGGLADVTGALPKALARAGHEVTVFSPAYRGVKAGRALARFEVRVGERSEMAQLCRRKKDGVTFYFVGNAGFFDRDCLYGTAQGDYPDNLERFVFFDRAVLQALVHLKSEPDVIHCHDWQTGLVPVYQRELRAQGGLTKTRTVFTIHNLGYQGRFPGASFPATGLPSSCFGVEGIEFYGDVNLLKAGLVFSDQLTTVSPTYAREIQTAELGFGLEGVLQKRARDLTGIVNGIDTEVWDPMTDKTLSPDNYDRESPDAKRRVKARVTREFGLDGTNRPLLAFIGRLSGQKGIELVCGAAERMVELGANLAVLGTGEEVYHRQLQELAGRFPRRVGLALKFDDRLARRLYAGSDILLMPSRYEPCGLGQLIAFRYGSVPVAHRTGGLADTVADCSEDAGVGNGFLFQDYTTAAFSATIATALQEFGDATGWKRIVARGMSRDDSWSASADRYVMLYQELLSES